MKEMFELDEVVDREFTQEQNMVICFVRRNVGDLKFKSQRQDVLKWIYSSDNTDVPMSVAFCEAVLDLPRNFLRHRLERYAEVTKRDDWKPKEMQSVFTMEDIGDELLEEDGGEAWNTSDLCAVYPVTTSPVFAGEVEGDIEAKDIRQ